MAEFQEVKERLDLTDYCDQRLERRGRNTYVCPACGSGSGPNRTAAFTVQPEKRSWHCFKCQKGGDIFDLIGIVEGIEDKGAQLERAAELAGMDTGNYKTAGKRGAVSRSKATGKAPATLEAGKAEYEPGRARELQKVEACKEAIADEPAAAYLTARGINVDEARRHGLGYDRQARRLTIPFPGAPWYHTDRAIDPADKTRYLKPRGEDVGKQPVWGADAIAGDLPYFVVEGPIDALAVEIAAPGARAVALCGTASRDYLEAVKAAERKAPVILMLDADEAGSKAAAELAEGLRRAGVPYIEASAGEIGRYKDAGDALAADRDGLRQFLMGKMDEAAEAASGLQERWYAEDMAALHVLDPLDVAGDVYNLVGASDPEPTGLEALDEALGGGLPGRGLVVLGALSSLGKTTLALQIADAWAARGKSVLFVTIEQGARELAAKSISRIMSAGGRTSGARMRASAQAVISPSQRAEWAERDPEKMHALYLACEEYARTVAPRLRILEAEAQPGAEDVRRAAEAMAAHDGEPPAVFIDYLQLLAAPSERDDDKRATDKNIKSLRQLARDLNTCVFAISSLNRSSYGEGVTLEAFKESGGIEYGSDVLLGLQPAGMADKVRAATGSDNDKKRAARDHVAASKAQERRRVEVVVLKNRNGSMPSRPAVLEFDALANTFSDIKGAEADGAPW